MTEGRFPMTSVAFLPPDGGVGFALADVLDTTQCDELIGVLARRGFSPTGGAYPRDYRDNDRLVFDDAELAARWFERVGAKLPRELVIDGVAWQLHGLNPRFRACRYRGGQAFCLHRDGPHQPDDATRSLLTLQLYLDDASGMTGGRTRFYRDRSGRELWAAIAPRRGTAIVFDHRVWHDGEAVGGLDERGHRSSGEIVHGTGPPIDPAPHGAVAPAARDRAVATDDRPPGVATMAPELRRSGGRGRDGALIATGYDGVVWEDSDVHAA